MSVNDFEEIDPYFLGLWLGDGNKDDCGITTMDSEIVDFLNNYAEKLKLTVRVKGKIGNRASTYYIKKRLAYSSPVECYSMDGIFINKFDSLKEAGETLGIKHPNNIIHVCTGRYKHCGGYKWKRLERKYYNPIIFNLHKLNLIRNKHIPEIVLNNTTDYKLKVLAGFIDSDGTKSSTYIITISQRYENLIDDLIILCTSLNLFTKKVNKTIKYKGKDYKYYALYISGENLLNCPIKLKRKQINGITHRKSKSTIQESS